MVDLAYVGQLLISGLLQGGVFALLAVGLTLIFGVMHFINLAHGDFMIVGAYLTFVVWGAFGLHPLLALPLVVAAGFLLVLPVHRFVFEPVLEDPVINQLLLTFGLAFLLEGILAYQFGLSSRFIRIDGFGSGVFEVGGLTVAKIRVIAFVAAVIALGALYVFLKRTRIGMGIRATAQNRTAASVVGVDTGRIYYVVMGLGTALAFGSGVLLAAIRPFNPFTGLVFVLLAFAIISIGGLGSMAGALIAGLAIGVFESLSVLMVSPSMARGLTFLLFIVVLLVRPEGLFGSMEQDRGL